MFGFINTLNFWIWGMKQLSCLWSGSWGITKEFMKPMVIDQLINQELYNFIDPLICTINYNMSTKNQLGMIDWLIN